MLILQSVPIPTPTSNPLWITGLLQSDILVPLLGYTNGLATYCSLLSMLPTQMLEGDIPLIKTFQWLSIAIRINSEILSMAF